MIMVLLLQTLVVTVNILTQSSMFPRYSRLTDQKVQKKFQAYQA